MVVLPPDADLSLLSYHVSARTTLNMLAGAHGYILPFSADCENRVFLGCSNRQRKYEPHSLKSHFYLFFHFLGAGTPLWRQSRSVRKFRLLGRCSLGVALGVSLKGSREAATSIHATLHRGVGAALVVWARPPERRGFVAGAAIPPTIN